MSKRRESSGRGGNSSSGNSSDINYRQQSAVHSRDPHSRNNNIEKYLNERNARFIKASLPGNANKENKETVQSSRAYIETRHSEPIKEHIGIVGESFELSDASETVSLSNSLKFPSQ